MQQRKVLFLVLTAFYSMGGIEKFNRALMRAFSVVSPEMGLQFSAAGLYDNHSDESYINSKSFRCYNGKKIWFVIRSIWSSMFQDELVLGHINLAFIGVVFKLLKPSKKLTVICHGIEVFEKCSGIKKKVLQSADNLLAVSNFTKQQLIIIQEVDEKKITVFPNTIDPYFKMPAEFEKPAYLQTRYKLKANEKILFTLTRIRSDEGYKGYDKILEVLPQLIKAGVHFRYILAGKADDAEEEKIKQLIHKSKLEEYVILPGFISDEEVTDHYLLADVFVMPSKGEGFGIVYLEAMACGLPVIAGNKDGSTEALQFGELGTLVDPDDLNDICMAVQRQLNEKIAPIVIQEKMINHFSFQKFTDRLMNFLKTRQLLLA